MWSTNNLIWLNLDVSYHYGTTFGKTWAIGTRQDIPESQPMIGVNAANDGWDDMRLHSVRETADCAESYFSAV